jgi:uncharacterized protein YcaQ
MQRIQLSLQQARRLAVISQGLHRNRAFGNGKQALLKCLDQLGYIQIDTISVVQRAHHHVLCTRLSGYQEQHLDDLQRSRQILEYWAHAAAYLPMQDYRYCLPRMHAIAGGEKHWHQPQHKLMREVLARVQAEGPLLARDFEVDVPRSGAGWWQWKPAKKALEQLFIQGQLMVSAREGFQKIYDVPDRVLPPGLDISVPGAAEYHNHLLRRAIQANGLVAEAEVGYLRKGVKPGIRKQLQELLEANELVQVKLPGIDAAYYTSTAMLDTLQRTRVSRQMQLLNPFDNLVIQRKRIQTLFDFDYQIECYVPAAKRRYGYYCLPILYGSELVGRLDPKAERRSQTLWVKHLELEKPVKALEQFASLLADSLQELARANGCRHVRLERCSDVRLEKLLKSLLKSRLAKHLVH